MTHKMKDGGKRKKFKSGAMREEVSGKGRYDLISPIMLQRLAIVMERGAKKYFDHNWELGMPLHRYLDSALRHTNQYLEGKRDEDHLAQAIFNLMAAIHTEEMIRRGQLPEELNDLPDYIRDKEFKVTPEEFKKLMKRMGLWNK